MLIEWSENRIYIFKFKNFSLIKDFLGEKGGFLRNSTIDGKNILSNIFALFYLYGTF
jgi:hypothetical protein